MFLEVFLEKQMVVNISGKKCRDISERIPVEIPWQHLHRNILIRPQRIPRYISRWILVGHPRDISKYKMRKTWRSS